MSVSLQGRYANIKTILEPAKVLAWAREDVDPDLEAVWARHDAAVPHYHIILRFSGRFRWNTLADRLNKADGHEYARPARSFRRSVRYCLHLDNPEKHSVPRENLGWHKINESELAELLGNEKLPILESLILAEKLPLKKRFQFLVCQRQHSPAEVSSALRCMMDLERWSETRTCAGLSRESALPDSVGDDDIKADGFDGFDDFEEGDNLDVDF